ncbi:hypothetical protein [Leptolyngbya phage Lbo-JY12]
MLSKNKRNNYDSIIYNPNQGYEDDSTRHDDREFWEAHSDDRQ